MSKAMEIGVARYTYLQPSLLQLNHSLTEPTPKSLLSVPANSSRFALQPHIVAILPPISMMIIQMGLELFPSIKDPSALILRLVLRLGTGVSGIGVFARWGLGRLVARLGAFPRFDLPVHRVFVAFPVVFAAEAAGAGSVGAAVGAGVSFGVFSIHTISISRSIRKAYGCIGGRNRRLREITLRLLSLAAEIALE